MLVEGGSVRSKNSINVILKNFVDAGLGTLGFWIIGFGLMFGTNMTGYLGTDGFMPRDLSGLESVELMYQMLFAVTAATIVSGAIAERTSFLPYIVGAFFITSVVYPVYGSWVWGGDGQQAGWLRAIGFYDAAGASVVHALGGWCALAVLILVGPRQGRFDRKGRAFQISGHNLPLVAIGGFILWFGWLGFNGGAVKSDFSNLGAILLTTHLGAVGGIVGAIAVLVLHKRGLLITYIVNGAIGGLVSVTGAVDVLSPEHGLLVGFIGGVITVYGTWLLLSFQIDDVVGAVPVHAFCGSWGALAAGIFYQGDMFNVDRMTVQFVGLIAVMTWAFLATYSIFWVLDKVFALRVTTRAEIRGLDISEHKEIGYSDFVTSLVKADK